AAILGGCCGTGPEHIAAIARVLAASPRRQAPPAPSRARVVEGKGRSREREIETSPLKRKLAAPGAFLVTAEIDPPRGTDVSQAVEAARVLRAAGVDAVNVT